VKTFALAQTIFATLNSTQSSTSNKHEGKNCNLLTVGEGRCEKAAYGKHLKNVHFSKTICAQLKRTKSAA